MQIYGVSGAVQSTAVENTRVSVECEHAIFMAIKYDFVYSSYALNDIFVHDITVSCHTHKKKIKK